MAMMTGVEPRLLTGCHKVDVYVYTYVHVCVFAFVPEGNQLFST